MLNKLLVAFDGSDQSYRAFDFALEMSRLCGSSPEITVLSIAQPPEPTGIVKAESIIESAKRMYEFIFKGLRERAAKINREINTDIIVGHPAHEIIKYATEKKIDIIIMGQRGRSHIEKWLLGSVSKRVSTYAPCTVTIVKS